MGVRRVCCKAGIVGAAVAPLLVSVAETPAGASRTATTITGVPENLRDEVAAGARACPDLPVHLLAAQLEAASGFDPAATRGGDRRGVAAQSPAEWGAWGSDADGDGVSSPLDATDAVVALARHMCSLYRTAVGSTVPGDRTRLALAGYHSGWSAVREAGGIPWAARGYVDRIADLSWNFGRTSGTSFGSGVGRTLVVPSTNPRGPRAAVTWARAQTAGSARWRDLCLNFTAQSYGWSYSGTHFAIDHYWVVPARYRHPVDRNPPAGALLYWDTGRRAGHVAIALGGGLVASNDIETPGRISVVPASRIEERWGARYLGWTAPHFPGGGFWEDSAPAATPPVARPKPAVPKPEPSAAPKAAAPGSDPYRAWG